MRGFLSVFAVDAAGTLIRGMKGLMSTDVVIDKVTAQAIFPTRYVKEETEDFTVPGVAVGECKAQNVQLCVTKKGDLARRSNVGHFHLGGLSESVYANGVIDVGGFGAQLGALLTGLEWQPNDVANAISYHPAILNKTKVIVDGKDKYVISGSTVQTFVEFNETLRVMRRRTVGLGI